ncbi:putative cyclin-dependent serine/threonine-protein kinase DDB_G0272797/DDB_G0274007 [Clarias gariepinus]|uniref:putative cyclin-dependent serine/threonine-protein kinase DDB_G0272797/DDB_G0274007 n=1 Tax=Clarias gariepinus TaxID=13013 RepID=UPI00234D2B79|nr:putative cyclin-dependent serine/threonine-protein kinase DDB_G0272797/DDB_G0274007 [Clarias gariepinus]
MSSWVVLLFALVACLRLCGAQDPLPVSLVNLVMDSPISSMKDLQELLDVHSVEEEEEEDEDHDSHGTHKRLPRSLGDVQMAQPAVCKVRTEVMEITRSMLDRSNANFLLWPLCVEVQRCSGCCNTRTLHCVPVTTQTRHLQMTKIQFVNRQPVYEKVILPVEDHVTCSCKSQDVGHTTLTKTTTSPPPPPPPRLVTKPPVSKSQSKEELHRHDDLKHNQRFQLDDRESQWQSKYTLSHTQRAPVHTPAHTLSLTHGSSSEDLSTRHVSFGTTRMLSDTAQQNTPTQEHHTHHSETEKVHEHHTRLSGDDNIKSTESPEHPKHHHHHHQNDDHESATKHELSKSHSTEHHQSQSDITLHHSGQLEAPTHSFGQVEVIGQASGQSEMSSQSSTPSFHQSEDKEQHQSQSETGQEKSEHHHHHHHHHHHLPPTQAATERAVTSAPAGTPPAPHTPPPAVAQRKRRRKQRRRMSKSAMRAMIMVMS